MGTNGTVKDGEGFSSVYKKYLGSHKLNSDVDDQRKIVQAVTSLPLYQTSITLHTIPYSLKLLK